MAWIRSDYDFVCKEHDNRLGIVVIDRRCRRAYRGVMRALEFAPSMESVAAVIETAISEERPDLTGVTAVAIRHDIDSGQWLIKCVHPSFDKTPDGGAIRRYPVFVELPPYEIRAGAKIERIGPPEIWHYTGSTITFMPGELFNQSGDDLPTPVYVEK